MAGEIEEKDKKLDILNAQNATKAGIALVGSLLERGCMDKHLERIAKKFDSPMNEGDPNASIQTMRIMTLVTQNLALEVAKSYELCYTQGFDVAIDNVQKQLDKTVKEVIAELQEKKDKKTREEKTSSFEDARSSMK